MRWLSIDPATKTGIARWEGSRLLSVATLRPATKLESRSGPTLMLSSLKVSALGVGDARSTLGFATGQAAWRWLLFEWGVVHTVVIEEAMGASPKTVAQLAYRRGYIAAQCELRGASVREVNTSSWRKVAGEAFGKSFPNKSDEAKALAIALVEKHFGVTCSDDEADAVLIGHWHTRTKA